MNSDVFSIEQDTTVFSFVSISILLLALFIVLNTTAIHERSHPKEPSVTTPEHSNTTTQEKHSVLGSSHEQNTIFASVLSKEALTELQERLPTTTSVRRTTTDSLEVVFPKTDLFIGQSAELKALAVPLLELVHQKANELDARVHIVAGELPGNERIAIMQAQAVYRLFYDKGTPPGKLSLVGQSTSGSAELVIYID